MQHTCMKCYSDQGDSSKLTFIVRIPVVCFKIRDIITRLNPLFLRWDKDLIPYVMKVYVRNTTYKHQQGMFNNLRSRTKGHNIMKTRGPWWPLIAHLVKYWCYIPNMKGLG